MIESPLLQRIKTRSNKVKLNVRESRRSVRSVDYFKESRDDTETINSVIERYRYG